MTEFPIIHTNIWDAVLAVPVTMILTQLIKSIFPIKRTFVPTIANLIGLAISLFYSHPDHLSAGLFMGFVYGSAAVGMYASLKTTITAFRDGKSDN
ncbi:hypothetical protein [Bacillus sp. CGMCC 1.16541]|uniref:hypothetical protein n=1 Tax=Bacillus sp. CGMCC 1.16541 TaxID=2185143 RepID=UPI000D735082|nr:hypothetical protein [Bacillus sp. CGMCC 1.16541]